MRKLLFILFAVPCFAQDPAPITPQQMVTFDGNSGNVSACSNCTINTFAAGTSTPLAVYTDSSLMTANTNPLVTNSKGYVVNGNSPSTITGVWIGSSCYKFIFKDSNGVTIWTQDNICDRAAILKALLASVTGATLIGFEPTAGTVPLTVASALNSFLIDSGYASFANACAAAVGASKTLLLLSHWTGVAAATYACNIWNQGGLLTVAASSTATFTGKITNPPAQQIFDTATNSAAVAAISSKCCAEIFPNWWGGIYDGTVVDDVPINASLKAAQGLVILHVISSSGVKNIRNPVTANPYLKIIWSPGVIWNCKNSDASACVVIDGTGNPFIVIEGQMVLYGPDGNTTSGYTTTSGHGLVIGGSGTPIVTLQSLVAWGFHGTSCTLSGGATGCAAFVPVNVEDSYFANLNLQLNNIGIKPSSGFLSNVVGALLCSQDDTYGCYMDSTYGNTFSSIVAQSNTIHSFLGIGFGGNTINSYHEENPNTSAVAVNTFEIAASSTFGTSTGNAFNSTVMLGSHGKAAITNTSSTNADNVFLGGSMGSGYQGITLDSGSSIQKFDNFITKSQILSGFIAGNTEVNETGNNANTYTRGAIITPFMATVGTVPIVGGFSGGTIDAKSTSSAGWVTVGGVTNNGNIALVDSHITAGTKASCTCSTKGSTTIACNADGSTSAGTVTFVSVGGNWALNDVINYQCTLIP